MKLLVDECCEVELVHALRNAGHDVIYAQEDLRGATDEAILNQSLSDERIIVTEDKDFGELVYRLRRAAHGILLLRFHIKDRPSKAARLLNVLDGYGEQLHQSFTVIENDKIRLRKLNPNA